MEIGDFIRQVPPGIVMAPIIFGALYIALTIYILRRAAARRRQKQQQAATTPVVAPVKSKWSSVSLGNLLRTEPAEKPPKSAEWSVSAELRGLPEPDLDMLVSPVALGQADLAAMVHSLQPAPEEPTAATSADLVAVMAPAQEEMPAMTNVSSDASPEMAEPGDAIEVMRIWRDLNDGGLIIQMGNQRYRALNEVQNPDLVRRFVAVVRELSAVANNAPVRSTGTQPAGTAPGIRKPGAPGAEPEQARPGVIRQIARQGFKQSPGTPPAQSAGIADEVEDYLQFKLSSTPEFASRSIHIRTSHDHGVRIEVDGHYYDAIGDVVDPDVREFLFAMMREWEARH